LIKCSIVSDLHIEFHALKDLPEGDILFLAGDIFVAAHMRKNATDATSRGLKKRYEKFCKEELSKFKNIVYVMGNHEHYHGIFEDTSSILREYLSKHASNVMLLNNESVVLHGVNIIGSSLWATYGCNTTNHMIIQENMNDCHVIKTQNPLDDKYACFKHTRKLNVFDINNEHQKSILFIENELSNTNLPCIVMTHHCPSYLSLEESGNMDDAYASNQHALIEKYKPKLCFHGHSHDSKTYIIYDTTIISNQRGYFGFERCSRFFNPSAEDFNLDDLIKEKNNGNTNINNTH
jgi:Icc-related predicted phosphoesterase